ncbi:uracil-DNA glycosylase family protein [Pseudomonas oryzihabitans]|uniref:uracil-DNA glycosylase family protein n=1 Tax=Pseudomonas oryzihabitans TaxID=47885 RepID=UPI0028ABD901|nr:uracil-DNA glycosylase family protein [Pseudomonas oryzihabitans]
MPPSSLLARYREILAPLDVALLDRSRHADPIFAGLSGLFLAGHLPDVMTASRRVMIVGRETRQWNVLGADKPFVDKDAYLKIAIAKSQKFLKRALGQSADPGCSFFNLVRELAMQCGQEGIIWANLFCFSWKRGSPMKTDLFNTIRDVSERLLKAQIEHLRPDLIIFANGSSSARVRQTFFPHKNPGSVCSDSRHYTEMGIAKGQLWSFRLYGAIPCYRIQHPSSRSRQARAARTALLQLLKSEQFTPCHTPAPTPR